MGESGLHGQIGRLRAAVHGLGGVARTSSLQRSGWSRYVISEAVRAGAVTRVRRDWIALPGADPDLLAAARGGVVLSCITHAKRAGLWVADADRLHVASSPHGASPRIVAAVHWAEPVVPRHPDSLVDRIENTLALVATCQPHESALAIWESALRRGAVSREILRGLALPLAARRLLDEAWSHADSGLETIFSVRLRWLGVRILPQAWILGHRVDFLIGERLVIQIDGGHHVGAQRTGDIRHDALLLLHGFHVIRLSYEQVMADWPSVQDTITRAIGLGLHLAA